MATIILWTQADCPLCEQVKNRLTAQESEYEERHASDLIRGDTPNDEALAQLAMQNMQVPLVQIDGDFVSPFDLLADETAA